MKIFNFITLRETGSKIIYCSFNILNNIQFAIETWYKYFKFKCAAIIRNLMINWCRIWITDNSSKSGQFTSMNHENNYSQLTKAHFMFKSIKELNNVANTMWSSVCLIICGMASCWALQVFIPRILSFLQLSLSKIKKHLLQGGLTETVFFHSMALFTFKKENRIVIIPSRFYVCHLSDLKS